MNPRPHPRAPYRLAFTLIELLVVIAIIGLVSVIALASILPAYRHRGITQGALLPNSVIVGAKDAAVRANAPRGFRLIQDNPALNPSISVGAQTISAATCSRMIPIELASDYDEGMISYRDNQANRTVYPAILQAYSTTPPDFVTNGYDPNLLYLRLAQQVVGVSLVANSPTEWFWNIRQGDRIRLNDSGRYMPIAGPMQTYTTTGNVASVGNPVINTERFINFDIPSTKSGSGKTELFVSPIPPSTGPTAPGSTYQINNNAGPFAPMLPLPPDGTNPEFFLVVNGQDDDGDGFTDNSFDGIDNDGDGVIDPGFDGSTTMGTARSTTSPSFSIAKSAGSTYYDSRLYINRNAYAQASWPYMGVPAGYNSEFELEGTPNGLTMGSFGSGVRKGFYDQPYTILRRPVPTQGAREVQMPAGVVIDLTTATQYGAGERSRLPIDPNTGAVDILVTPTGTVLQAGANGLEAVAGPFYHFWICEREDVYPPISTPNVLYRLPMPTMDKYPAPGDTTNRVLKNEHRLITLFTRTGQVTTNTIDDFDPTGNSTTTPLNYGINRPYIEAQLGLRETP